ncbi:hypothetical protein ONZ43_g5044 [Nemania bipapillata]|uniref:Uncharacterized protein n=1 Tax=Nemania bipapillata TaxID=110536 RepID=A0ACC2IF98_9PEZI|nr:hypothetical protein ONZ43_g5044 [Nemania bipapillata]
MRGFFLKKSPPGCIVATEFTLHLKPPLVDFDIVQEYIIPRKAFFNRFVTVNTPDGKHSILGFPVSIPHERYHRNEFIFNFGLVIESDVDHIPYERLVRRFAVTFGDTQRQHDGGGRIPGLDAARTLILCNVGDLVCEGTLVITGAHLSYTASVPAAVSFIVNKV